MSGHGGGRRRRKHHDDHEEHPSEAWLIALADMMTLLMVTFLMMFAISNLDLQKFKTFQEAFAEGTGASLPALPGEGVPTEGEVVEEARAPVEPAAQPAGDVLDAASLEELRKKVQAQLDKAGLADRIQAKTDRRGLVLYVTSGVLFGSGRADVTAVGRTLLDSLGPVLRGVGNDLVVEGHTDSRPVRGGRFASNWELSAMRATAVARQLMDDGKIDSKRVSIAGYADTRPRRNLPGEAAFAANRRVEIVVEAPTALVTAAAEALAPRAPAAPPAAAPPAAPAATKKDSG